MQRKSFAWWFGVVGGTIVMVCAAVGLAIAAARPPAPAPRPAASGPSCPGRPVANWPIPDPPVHRHGELCLYQQRSGLEFQALSAEPRGLVSIQVLECQVLPRGAACLPELSEQNAVVGHGAVKSPPFTDRCFWAQATTGAGQSSETAETAPKLDGPGTRTCLVAGKFTPGLPAPAATQGARS